MGETGFRIWRTVGGIALGASMLILPIGGPTAAAKPIVYAVSVAVAVIGVLWAFKIIGTVGLLNAFTAAVVIVGLVSATSIDGPANLGYLSAGFVGLICVGIWIASLVRGRSDRPPRWWINPKWWIVPVLAVLALVLTPVVESQRFEGSRAELTAFAEQQLAVPLKGDGTGRCETHDPPVAVGTYRIRFTCVSDHYGLYRLSVSMRFDDSSDFELDYGDPDTGGPRVWHKYMTHS